MTNIASFIKWHERYPIYETETWVTKLKISIYAQHGMVTSITFLHHGIHWTLYFNIVYKKISILLNHLRTSSFAPSVNFSTNRLIFVRPLRAVILFIWEQWGISTMLSTTIQAIPTLWEAGMAQWQEFSSPTAVSSHRGVELLVLVLATTVFFGCSCFLPPPQKKKKKKNQHSKFNSNWKQWTRRTTSWYVQSYITIIIPTIVIITQWSNFVNAKQTSSFSSSFGYLAR